MAIYNVKPMKAETLEDVKAILDLMTITMESGDPVCDAFVAAHPHLVEDVTETIEAFNEVFPEADLSGVPVIPN